MNNWLILIFCLTLVTTVVGAQDTTSTSTLQTYQKAFASPEGRNWILKAWGTRLGTEIGCTEGISWLFFSDGLLLKRACVDGQIEDKRHSWSLAATDEGPIELTIDSQAHWVEILTDKVSEPGLPPLEVLIAKIQEVRDFQERQAKILELRRSIDGQPNN